MFLLYQLIDSKVINLINNHFCQNHVRTNNMKTLTQTLYNINDIIHLKNSGNATAQSIYHKIIEARQADIENIEMCEHYDDLIDNIIAPYFAQIAVNIEHIQSDLSLHKYHEYANIHGDISYNVSYDGDDDFLQSLATQINEVTKPANNNKCVITTEDESPDYICSDDNLRNVIDLINEHILELFKQELADRLNENNIIEDLIANDYYFDINGDITSIKTATF